MHLSTPLPSFKRVSTTPGLLSICFMVELIEVNFSLDLSHKQSASNIRYLNKRIRNENY